METAQIVKSRLLLNLVLVLALAGLGLYAYLRPTEEDKPKIAISQLERDEIDRIRLERVPDVDLQLEKRNGAWLMTRPYQTRADPLEVDRLLDVAMGTASEVFPAENLSRYGLDPAPVRVTLNDQSFAFGNINEVTNEQYIASGGQIYLARTYLGYSLPTDSKKLISHKLIADTEKPVAFDFGHWQAIKNDKGAWSLQGKLAADVDLSPTPDELNIWVAEWQLASALSVTPHEGTSGGARVILQFSNGDRATFRVLQRQPDVELLRVEENMRYRLGEDAGGRLLDPYRVADR